MCLILFSVNHHPKYKFILAANRDEFFNRPTEFADFWKNDNNVLGGLDLSSGGTWLGLTKTGRFAAITNYRDGIQENKLSRSRGDLSKSFLQDSSPVQSNLSKISSERNKYNGFNILLSHNGFSSIFHYSNINNQTLEIKPGIHGLSNAYLDTPWPKADEGKRKLADIISKETFNSEELIQLLTDKKEADDAFLPQTNISYDLEKKLSPIFISMNGYGTRCSTVILIDYENNVQFLEISYDENQQIINECKYSFPLKC